MLFLVLLSSPELSAQDASEPAQLEAQDEKAFRRLLRPGTPLPRRSRAIRAVTAFDNADAAALLSEGVAGSFQQIVRLEKERAEIDRKIDNQMLPRMRTGSRTGFVDYSGIEEWQKVQARLGREITLEEQAIRVYRESLIQLKDGGARTHLRRLRPKRPLRLRLFLIELFAHYDEDRFSEVLIDLLSDREFQVRLAAAAALSHHSRDQVPTHVYGGLLDAKEWQARAVAIDALGRRGGQEAVALLIQRVALEQGRLLTDICDRLELLTGQKFGNTPAAWISWWNDNKDSFKTDRVVLTRPVKAERDGQTRYWGIRVDSLRVVFVIDVSGTMAADLKDPDDLAPPPGKARLDLARREVKNAIASLPSDSSFNVIAYNDFVMPWRERQVKASAKNRRSAQEFLDNLFAFGATNIYDSLELAFRISAPGTKDKYYDQSADTILFLSDGGPTAGRTTEPDEILAAVRDWNRVKQVVIHVIGVGRQINKPLLESLARDSGGEIRFIE